MLCGLYFGFVCLHFLKLGQKAGLHRTVLKEALQADLVLKGESYREEKLCGMFGLWSDANLPLGARKGNLE